MSNNSALIRITDDPSLPLEGVWEDLQCAGLQILQSHARYCFSSDAALLANYAREGVGKQVCELCAGTSVISHLVAAKSRAERIAAVELQPELAAMAARSVAKNGLEHKVEIYLGDACVAWQTLCRGNFDSVLANPPYFRVGEGEMNPDPSIAMCRHETHLKLRPLLESAAKLLKYGGRLYLVYTAGRLAELLDELRHVGLEPKHLLCVQPTESKPIDTVLVTAKKGANSGMTVECALRTVLENRYYKE